MSYNTKYIKLLIMMSIFLIYSLSPVKAALIAHYDFNENSGSIAHDKTGAHDGNIVGATYVTGFYGSALKFDGIADQVVIPYSTDFYFADSNFTIMAWVKSESFYNGSLIKNWDAGWRCQFGTIYSNRFCFFVNNANQYLYSPVIPLNEWIHVAYVKNGTTLKCYINSNLVKTNSAVSAIIGPNSGNTPTTVGYIFKGIIDDIKIYNSALTAEQIRANSIAYNVKSYGAVGDGVVDDTAAIQAADVAAKNANAEVYFPAGTYKLKDALMTAKRWFGTGNSSIIKADINSSCAAIAIYEQENSTIDSLLFTSTAIDTTTQIFGINAENSSSITIIDVKFATGLNNGVRVMTCDDLFFTKNIIENMIGDNSGHGYGFLFHTECTNGMITDNKFYSSPGKGRHGIYVTSGSSYFNISNNHTEGYYLGAIQCNTYSNQPYTHHINIENNICMDDINDDNHYSGAITITGKCSDILIKNNIVDGAYVGISIYGTDDAIAKDIEITNNTVSNIKTDLIALRACENIIVKKNKLSNGGLEYPFYYSAILVSNYDNEKYKNIEIYRNHLFNAPDLKRFLLIVGDNNGGDFKVINNKVETLWGIDIVGGTINQNIYIYNNTFSLTMQNNIPPIGLYMQADAIITANNSVKFTNNIVTYTNPTYAKYLYYYPTTLYGQLAIDNNCYYNTTSTTPFFYQGVNKSWNDWNALNFDITSFGPNTNPLLDENLDLLSNSSCINSGASLNEPEASFDFYGTPRITPDIGCYEY